MNPGAIHWVEFPPGGGHEQTGRRPAIVLQDDTHAGSLPTILVVPLTGAVAALRFSGTVAIDPTPRNGLQTRSVALVFQLRAIDRQRLRDRLGELDPELLTKIHEELDRLLGRKSP